MPRCLAGTAAVDAWFEMRCLTLPCGLMNAQRWQSWGSSPFRRILEISRFPT